MFSLLHFSYVNPTIYILLFNFQSNSTSSEDPLGDTNIGGDDQTQTTTPIPEEPTSPVDLEGTETPEEPLELPGPDGDGNEQSTETAPPDTDGTSVYGEHGHTSLNGPGIFALFSYLDIVTLSTRT